MARILVTETIADGGLDRLRAAGHTVDVQEGLTPEQLCEAIVGAHALIIRSATDVTASALSTSSARARIRRMRSTNCFSGVCMILVNSPSA